jgi:predicted transcriptional regulator
MKIEIVEHIQRRMNEDNRYVKEVLQGKKRVRARREKTIIMTPETFSKIFSPQRIKLMLRIRKNNIKNIYQLAQVLNRKYEAVHRDIKLLEGFGIIKIKEKKNQRIPFMDESRQQFEFAV